LHACLVDDHLDTTDAHDEVTERWIDVDENRIGVLSSERMNKKRMNNKNTTGK
jgi:hypothetical protein